MNTDMNGTTIIKRRGLVITDTFLDEVKLAKRLTTDTDSISVEPLSRFALTLHNAPLMDIGGDYAVLATTSCLRACTRMPAGVYPTVI